MRRILLLLLALVFLLACAGCGRATGKESTPTPEATATPQPTATPAPVPTIAMVIAFHYFNHEEFINTRDLFMVGGYEIQLASQQTGTAVSQDGHEEQVDLLISDLDPQRLDALVIIGGTGVSALNGDSDLISLVRDMIAARKPAGAIGLAPSVLANMGMLSGKEATVSPDEAAIASLEEGGATYIEDEDVVADGNIVTANGSDAAKDFVIEILGQLGSLPSSF